MTMRLPRHWTGLDSFEPLERRRTLSTTSVVDVASAVMAHDIPGGLFQTTPADGAILESSQSPNVVTLRLGRTTATLWTSSLIDLERIESDGTGVSLLKSKGGAAVSLDPASGVVTFSLAAPLGPGRYALILQPGSISGFLSGGRWDSKQKQVVAGFEVRPDLPVLPTDLGVLGSSVLSPTGTLANTDGAQDVYKIRLADSQPLWQVGLQLDAGRIGSDDLVSNLAIYNQSGDLVKEAYTGLFQPQEALRVTSKTANDPYLFDGLAPGDYYVVVAKAAGHPGGAYRLNLVADPAKPQATVTAFSLDHVDGTATGFTLAFSAPLDPNSIWTDSVYAVDSAGRTYGLKMTRVDYGLQRVGYTFTSAVPAGEYSVVINGTHPLTDLVGRTPVAGGLPAGMLANFTLTTADAPLQKPKPGQSKSLGGGVISLPAGASIDVPIVVDDNALVRLYASARRGSLRIEVIGTDATNIVRRNESIDGELIHLTPGAYVVRLTAVSHSSFVGSWSLVDDANHDDLVGDAVGPGGVLAIRLGVDRTASSPSPLPWASTTDEATSTGFDHRDVSASAAVTPEMGPSPWAVGSTVNSTLLGRPTADSDAVVSVGPTVPGGTTPVASALIGPFSSIAQFIATPSQADDGLDRGPAGESENPSATHDHDENVVRAEAKPGLAAPDADEAALLQADRVLAALRGGIRWLFDGLGDAAGQPSDAQAEAPGKVELAAVSPSEGLVERSSLDLPVGVLFVTASTVHLRRAALRWWRRHRAVATAISTATAPSGTAGTLFRGPRKMTPTREPARAYGPRRG